MPVDGKHSRPITATISNHRGQGSTPIHHLSSSGVSVMRCCVIAREELKRPECTVMRQREDSVHVHVHSEQWCPSWHSRSIQSALHKHAHTDSKVSVQSDVIKSGWWDRSAQTATLWEGNHNLEKSGPSCHLLSEEREAVVIQHTSFRKTECQM